MLFNINKFSNCKFIFNTNDDFSIRLPNVNPNKIYSKNIDLIVFNSNNIIFNNKEYSIDHFKRYFYNKTNKYICLTKTQSKLSEFKVKSIFSIFPFLNYVDYSNFDLNEQYKILNELFNKYKDLFSFDTKYNSIQNQYSYILKFKQSRKLRFKSCLDNNFFFSIKTGFSDVFKLLENRPNRTIYQLDVNSMYPFAMIQNNFSIPRNLKYYEKNNLNDILNGNITNGIFNCKMTIKKELNDNDLNFIKYIPINIIKDNTSIPLDLNKNDKVNILLHSNEIKYYSKFFDITLEDGIYSKKSMNHPLKNWVLETYQKRLNAEGPLKDFYKFILVLSHSIAMSYSTKSDIVDNNLLEVLLDQEYQIKTDKLSINNKYFRTKQGSNNNVKFEYYNLKNSNNVYSLYSQVLANARIHLLELYEKFYKQNSNFELCYCNIDSLHISIPNELNYQFNIILEQVSSKTELGKLKIESISNRGIWFEPGRYWLFKDEKLISYKNTIFNDENSDYDCSFKKISYISNKKYKTNYFSLFKTLQHKKKIERIDDNHYIMKKNNGFLSLTNNLINNMNIFKEVFYRFIKR